MRSNSKVYRMVLEGLTFRLEMTGDFVSDCVLQTLQTQAVEECELGFNGLEGMRKADYKSSVRAEKKNSTRLAPDRILESVKY